MKIQSPLVHSKEGKRMRWLCNVVVLSFGIALMGATPLAAQGNCQPVLDAMNKVFATPSHIYRTTLCATNTPTSGRRYEVVAMGWAPCGLANEQLLTKLADVPTPAGPTPRQLCREHLVELQAYEQPRRFEQQ